MRLRQEFLLFFIAVSYTGLMVSIPIEKRDIVFLKLALNNLRKAENQYVHHLFDEVPNAYSNGTLEPLDGISVPVRNTTDPNFQESVDAIHIYLEHCLPALVRTIVPDPSTILSNTNAFLINFQKLANKLPGNKPADLQQCRTDIEKLNDYAKKEFVLKIFYFSRKWTEKFIQHYNHTSHR